jgi:hypothetical protein
MKRVRHLTEATKKTVAANQHFQCANKPGSNIESLDGYKCPLWQLSGGAHGCFDESTYEIDHIDAHSLTQDDSIGNLQALCKMCHGVKTRKFMMQNKHTREFAHHNKCTYEDKINALTKELEEIKKIINFPTKMDVSDEAVLLSTNGENSALPSVIVVNNDSVPNDIVVNNNGSPITNITNNNVTNITICTRKKKIRQCPSCSKIFSRNNILQNHIKNSCKGPNAKKTQCDYCSHIFSKPANLKTHIRRGCKIQKGNNNQNMDLVDDNTNMGLVDSESSDDDENINMDELLKELKSLRKENKKLKCQKIL